MNRDSLLYNLTNAIAYRGRISHKDKYFKDPEASDYIMPRILPIFENDYQASELDRRRKLIKAIHEHEPGALESVLNQFIFDADFMIERKLDEEKDRKIRKKEKEKTEQMIRKIAAEQKQKAGNRKTLPHIEDEYLYQLMTCKMVLESGAGFFKIEAIGEETEEYETYKIVSKGQPVYSLKSDETTVVGALAKLLPSKRRKKPEFREKTIEKHLQKYNKEIKPGLTVKYDKEDKAFTEKLRKFFFESREKDGKPYKYGCNYAGITEFVFIQKDVTTTPKGILTYLLENIITISTAPTTTAPVSVDFMLQDDLKHAKEHLSKFSPGGKFEKHKKAQLEDAVQGVMICNQNIKKRKNLLKSR